MSSTNNQPVLFIARVFPNIHEKRIRGIIGALNIGKIDHIDIKPWDNKEGKSFNKVYVHLIWNTDKETEKIVSRLQEGKDIKLVYDDPWFWKVSAYKSPTQAVKRRPTAKIVIEEDDESLSDSDTKSSDSEKAPIIVKKEQNQHQNVNNKAPSGLPAPKRRGGHPSSHKPLAIKDPKMLEHAYNDV
jgi:hypothetical protein